MYLRNFRDCKKIKKRVVIGTTGFTKKEENLVKELFKKIPILKAGNMSLGINLLMYLTEITSQALEIIFLAKYLKYTINIKKIIRQEQHLCLVKELL